MGNGEKTDGKHISPVVLTENEKKSSGLTLEKRTSIPIKRREQAYNFDSYAVFRDGQLVDRGYLDKLSAPELVQTVMEVSTIIEQKPEIKAFTDGKLNTDKAKGEEALAYQYLDILDALSNAARANHFSVDDLRKILDYVYDTEKVKPFMEGLTSEVFGAVLYWQKDVLYSALETRKRSLADANSTIDKLPYGGIFLVDGEPTLADLSQYFTQTEDEAEKNLVVDSAGRIFLVKGMDKNTGTITYRHFPDIVRDFHTHRVDYPFSTGDIGTYKSLGASRDIYDVVSRNIDFFVCSPNGIFEFNGNLEEDVFDKQDRKTDTLLIPCKVLDFDSGTLAEFKSYTNHYKGEAGRHIQKLIQEGSSGITITFDNGDTIQFASWSMLKRQGLSIQGVRDFHLR